MIFGMRHQKTGRKITKPCHTAWNAENSNKKMLAGSFKTQRESLIALTIIFFLIRIVCTHQGLVPNENVCP